MKDTEFFEDLTTTGNTCPPEDTFEPNSEQDYFRVIKKNRAVADSFLPKKLSEEDKAKIDPCIAKSLSVSDSLQSLINSYFKTPANKKREILVGTLRLMPTDGLLKQTFAAGHHSWWRSKAFDPSTTIIQTIEQ